MTTRPTDGRSDTTRRQILRAAAQQFARRPYHDVGLDEILAEADLTKGAMYFHFRSKHALAVAIIETGTAAGSVALNDLLSRNMSGLETLIDFSYQLACQDIRVDLVRAALNLLESVGRSAGLEEALLDGWMTALAAVAKKAIADGDLHKQCNPQDVGRLVVSLHMGLRRTSDLDQPERFLLELEKLWHLMLTGVLEPDRIDYFSQFIRRRTALAISTGPTGAYFT
ncbi:TetR/AcrR family transcriptional regulator [Mycobacterium scrofulaceum]|uniref:TetR family transcriptional regulator n=1 Tax=Mycobacterium scrofulaceum TaxID=1783 RepID=A0A1A2W1R9_MYCSC|nr:TetR/AcrR family transcriptional regulator [Mycobacterium scrofulaceum]OBI06827.1 TetR family transcriptional regulator [Mycobacterium scrofulaceum]